MANSSQWVMPQYRGRDICDWVEVVAQLKREGNLPEALTIAVGSLRAMEAAALRNPANVMEFYVTQVAIVQRKMKDYRGEIATLEGWLARGLPPARQDHRLDVQKRLAKAKELHARSLGQDSSVHTAEWKRLVAAGNALRSSGGAPSTGRSATSRARSFQGRSRGGTRWIAPAGVLESPTFVAVDFETANSSRESACQVALVKVHAGRIVDKFSTLLAPPRGYDSFQFTYLHGIGPRQVRRAPTWAQVAPHIAYFSANLPMFAHNASFDAGVWSGLDGFFQTRTRPASFYCSYRTARHLVPGLANYKLPTVTAHLVPEYRLDHHRADSDAEACALIVAALQRLKVR